MSALPVPTLPRPLGLLLAGVILLLGRAGADLYPDWCEGHFTPGEIAAGLAAPRGDPDSDGQASFLEYLAGSDPRDPASRFVLQAAGTAHPGKVRIPRAPGCEDLVFEVLLSDDLHGWSPGGSMTEAGNPVEWDLAGSPFVTIRLATRVGYRIDSDRDGLDDFFEEALAAADPHDALRHLGDVHPDDDFDGNGTPNIDEEGNRPAQPPGGESHAKPDVVPLQALNLVLEAAPAPAAAAMEVHTPLNP